MNARELKHQHSLQVWTQTIHECKNSGMTVKDWCSQNDVNEKRFYYWQRRVREEVLAPAIATQETPTTFIQMPTIENEPLSLFRPDMVLDYGNLKMEISNTVSPDLLAKVIQVIHHV